MSEQDAGFLLTRIKNSQAANRHPLVLGFFEGERLVGFVFGFDFQPANWWAQQINDQLPQGKDWYDRTFELNELAILPSHQKQGRGRQLMNHLLECLPHPTVLLGTKKGRQ